MVNNKKTNTVLIFFLGFLYPLFGGIMSLYNFKEKYSKNLFWLFCAFLGIIHIYHPEGSILGDTSDAGRYALELISMHNNVHSFDQFLHILSCDSTLEIYQPLLTFIISRFTANPHWLFFVFSVVYGFFYSRNIWYILDKLPRNIVPQMWILIFLYILICPIWNINGVRMWTALHIYCFGVFPYLFNNDKSKLLIAISSVFVHFSFVMPVVLLGIYFFIPNKIKTGKVFIFILFSLFLLTLGVEIFNINQIADLLYKIAPNLFETNVSGYLGSEYIDKIDEIANEKSVLFKLVKFIEKYGITYLVLLSFSFIYRSFKANIYKEHILRFFSFGLLMYSIANILAILPSGGRFIVLARMFVLPSIILIFMYLGNRRIFVNNLTRIVFALFLLVIIMQFRIGMENYGVDLFLGNFITALFVETNVSLFMIINYIL